MRDYGGGVNKNVRNIYKSFRIRLLMCGIIIPYNYSIKIYSVFTRFTLQCIYIDIS
jgi:hypothetical protein